MVWWRDSAFLLALMAAPAAWGGLAMLGHQMSFGALPAAEPLRYLMLSLLYPLLEEPAFRGLLQGRLRRHRWGRRQFGPLSGANLITSAVFVALHTLAHTPPMALLVLFPSLVFGYFRDRDGTLTRPIALHIVYNSGYFLLFGG